MRVMAGGAAQRFQMNPIAARQNRDAFHAGTFQRRDTVSISSQGRTANLINSLMEQKEAIVERKNSLLVSTAKDDTPFEAIKAQIDTYQEQLDSIDKQISDIMAMQRKTELEKNTQPKAEKKPKTEEEVETKKTVDLTKLSVSIDKMDLLNNAKAQVDGEVRVRKAELEQDKLYNHNAVIKLVINAHSRPSQPTSMELLSAKEAHISELESVSDDISADLSKEIGEANKTLREDKKTDLKPEEKREQEAERSKPHELDCLA